MEILSGIQTVNNYPYGSLKCTITFEIEFKSGKGFRMKTQTTNPKTGRLNAPKYTTYSDYAVLVKEEETGRVVEHRMMINGFDKLVEFCQFVKDHNIQFTPEQSIYLWKHTIQTMRISAVYTTLKEGFVVSDAYLAFKIMDMIKMQEDGNDFEDIATIEFDLDEVNKIRI